MYQLKLHPEVESDLKELDKTVQIQVFKKLKNYKKHQNLGLYLAIKTT